MTTYALFLRGINVGGHNKLPMPRLREVAVEAGLAEPATYLQSGNLVGSSSRSATRIATDLRAALVAKVDLDVPVVVRTAGQIVAAIEANPLGEPADASRLFVSFCEHAVGRALAGLDPAAYAPETFGVVGREIYTWLPDGMHKARLTNALLERRVGGVATARNWRTVLAVRDLMAS